MAVHNLKILPEHYADVTHFNPLRRKTVEIRKEDDRVFFCWGLSSAERVGRRKGTIYTALQQLRCYTYSARCFLCARGIRNAVN